MGRVLDLDWYLDRYVPPPKQRRKFVNRMPEPRQRWRMTLDELCYAAKIDPVVFDSWADAGLLGSRLAARPNNGRGRHITRLTAQRTVIVARLVAAGMRVEAAGHVAAGHKVGDTEPLEAGMPGGVQITISREDLP